MEDCAQTRTEIRRSRWLLLAIVLLGAALRLYGLGSVPIWIDDYGTVAYLKAPNWTTYLALVRFLSPDHVPLYFLLQYFWTHLVGTTTLAVQLLSVAAGLSAIPLLFRLGTHMWGRSAGLVAALILAVSPFHIWYAQAARYTVFVDPLSLLSVYALLRAVQDDSRRAWALNLAVNMILIWTHVLTVLLIGTQFVFILTARRRVTLRLLAWLGVQALVAVAALVWLRSSSPYTVSAGEDDYDWNKQVILVDLLADDATSLSQAPMYFSSPSRWITRTPYSPEGLITGWGLFNLGLMLLFVWAIALVVGKLIGRASAAWRGNADPTLRRNTESFLFLLYLAVLPLAVLVILSHLMRPLLMPQYTMYSSIALYGIVGAAVATIRRPWRIGLSLAAIVVIYGYQLGIMLPETTRTDWRGAALEIRAHAAPTDLVLVRGRFYATETFRFAFSASSIPVVPAYTLQSICEKSATCLRDAALGGACRPESVWAVIEVSFNYPPLPLARFEQCLRSRGLTFARKNFPGMGGLALYRISADAAAPAGAPLDMRPTIDYAHLLSDLHLPPNTDLHALQRVVETAPPLSAYTYTQFAVSLADEGCFDLAEAAARTAIRLAPDSPMSHFVLAIALGGRGDRDGAAAAFATAMAIDHIGFLVLYQPLFRALFEEPDLAAAQSAIARLNVMEAFIPQCLRMAAGPMPCAERLKTCR